VIEAGHLAQLVMEHAVPLGFGLCPIGELGTGGVRRHCSLGDDQDVIVSLWVAALPPRTGPGTNASSPTRGGTGTSPLL
jgi:hypothetical protein